MLLVKVTVFLIVLTVIYRFIVNGLVEQEDANTKLNMVFNNKFPAYVIVFCIMVVVDVIGAVASMFWFLFLR